MPHGLSRRVDVPIAIALGMLVLSVSASPVQQTPGRVTESSIAGRVVDAVSGRPVEGATISTSSPVWTTQALSDGSFRLVVTGPANSVRLSATKPGYLTGRPGTLGPDDYMARPIDIAAGDRIENVVIKMWAQVSITGRVTDEQNAPVANASVVTLARSYTGAGWRWQARGATARTDGQGVYRVDRLEPGAYLIMTRRPVALGADPVAEPPVYFPDARTASAALVVTLDAGDQRTADLRLGAPAKFGSLSGQITGSDRSTAGMKIHLSPMSGDATVYDEITTLAGDDGRFRFTRVPEGQYRLSAFQFPPSDEPLFSVGGDFFRTIQSTGTPGRVIVTPLPAKPTWVAEASATIDEGRETTVTMPAQPGARIRGRVVFDGATVFPVDKLQTIPVAVRPADGGIWVGVSANVIADNFPMGPIEPDGSFTSIGLPPGIYVVALFPAGSFSSGADALRGWTMSSLVVNGREMLGDAIRVEHADVNDVVLMLTDKITQIAGAIQDTQGRPAPDARVIVFPKHVEERNRYFVYPALQRIGQVAPTRSATFTMHVAPGEYLVAAVTRLPTDWMTPEHLQTLVPQAVSAQAALGATVRVNVIAR